jgi:hypothetical protein
MDYETEIRDLKAALLETKMAVAGLGVCIAQTLERYDPKLRPILTSNLRDWLGQARFREQTHVQEVVLMLGHAFVDPAFPLSSIPPNEAAE